MSLRDQPPSVRTMRLLSALVVIVMLGSAGCSIALPIAAATSPTEPDRTPREDRIALAFVFGSMIDLTVIGVIYCVRQLRRTD